MKSTPELQHLKTIKTGKGLIKLIVSLRTARRNNKNKEIKRKALTKKQREIVLAKTDRRCHVCGIELELNNFHADHVKSHITGGIHAENNYLPSCSTCNNLRWHYSPEEIQVIMKLGRWLKTKMLEESKESLSLAKQFVKHDMQLRRRRSKL